MLLKRHDATARFLPGVLAYGLARDALHYGSHAMDNTTLLIIILLILLVFGGGYYGRGRWW